MIEKRVGIGDVKVEQGDIVLTAYGVGSCVVIILYNEQKRVGGLAHVLLPAGNDHSWKYPRGAVMELIRGFGRFGVSASEAVAKIVGGATMFENFLKQAIGKRNVNETRDELKKANIPIVAEDVLGSWGRTVLFNIGTGTVTVKSYRHGEKVL
ncbi:MAG TPA: chemotaxis protein CheD [bacterium]|jgi:chemotaxis protein CheD